MRSGSYASSSDFRQPSHGRSSVRLQHDSLIISTLLSGICLPGAPADIQMRPTARLCHRARITLFTRANCSLCEQAKTVLARVGQKSAFVYEEIDVMAAKHKQWKDMYEFDAPVVRAQPWRDTDSILLLMCVW